MRLLRSQTNGQIVTSKLRQLCLQVELADGSEYVSPAVADVLVLDRVNFAYLRKTSEMVVSGLGARIVNVHTNRAPSRFLPEYVTLRRKLPAGHRRRIPLGIRPATEPRCGLD